jgi:hypothetical protein
MEDGPLVLRHRKAKRNPLKMGLRNEPHEMLSFVEFSHGELKGWVLWPGPHYCDFFPQY